MEFILGLARLFTLFLSFGGIWYLYKKKKPYQSLALIILIGIILRFFCSSDLYLHEWDERYHALVAKNMISDPLTPKLYSDPILPYDYRDWSSNHIWVHKQPLPLWVMAGSMKLFGVNEIALRLPSIIFSTLCIFILFHLSRELYGNKVALLSAFFISTNGLILDLASGKVATDHIDVHFLFFILLAIYTSFKQSKIKKIHLSIFIGVFTGAAILVKWLPALIVFPVWICFYLNKNNFDRHLIKNIVIASLSIIIIALPWQIYIHNSFPLEASWESSFNVKHIFEGLEGHGQPFWYHFQKMGRVYGEIVYIPLIWFIYNAIKKRHDLKKIALIIWFAIPLLFFSLVKTKMQAYTLFAAPSIMIIYSLSVVSG